MKQYITILMVIFSLNLFSQSFNYEGVSNKTQKGSFTEYTAENGQVFKVRDTITIGEPYNGGDFKNMWQNAGLGSFHPVYTTAVGETVVINKMKAVGKKALFYTSKPGSYNFGLMISVELAIRQNEIVTNIMTSDKALEELKKWKDKLDLELISKEEYEAKKAELKKFIK